MTFDQYLESAWTQHVDSPAMVAEGFERGLELLSEPSHLTQFANLATHVFGEHLGQFKSGWSFIGQLMAHPLVSAKELKDLLVYQTILQLAEDRSLALDQFSDSERVRILATAASICAGVGNISAAADFFERAIQNSTNLIEGDASRAMAVGSNNLAATLEEKPNLTESEKNLMIGAALQARKFWAIAGNWLQIERAEHRLAECFLKAGDILNSIKHANLCLTICEENHAPALEMFFAYKAVASVEKAMKQNLRSLPLMEKHFELLSAEDKIWCKKDLDKFKS